MKLTLDYNSSTNYLPKQGGDKKDIRDYKMNEILYSGNINVYFELSCSVLLKLGKFTTIKFPFPINLLYTSVLYIIFSSQKQIEFTTWACRFNYW